MTGQSTIDDLMIRPFPRPGPLIELAYRDLNTAATGNDDLVNALGDLNILPRPWDPAHCQADYRAEMWSWLEEVAHWLNTEYCWDPTDLIPACWPQHPHLVHELAVLADRRRIAGRAFVGDLLEEWHRTTLPSFNARVRAQLRNHCDDTHQPWPAKGRQTRYANGSSDRIRHFAADMDPERPTARHSFVEDGEV